jgi:hypothetical protein
LDGGLEAAGLGVPVVGFSEQHVGFFAELGILLLNLPESSTVIVQDPAELMLVEE